MAVVLDEVRTLAFDTWTGRKGKRVGEKRFPLHPRFRQLLNFALAKLARGLRITKIQKLI